MAPITGSSALASWGDDVPCCHLATCGVNRRVRMPRARMHCASVGGMMFRREMTGPRVVSVWRGFWWTGVSVWSPGWCSPRERVLDRFLAHLARPRPWARLLWSAGAANALRVPRGAPWCPWCPAKTKAVPPDHSKRALCPEFWKQFGSRGYKIVRFIMDVRLGFFSSRARPVAMKVHGRCLNVTWLVTTVYSFGRCPVCPVRPGCPVVPSGAGWCRVVPRGAGGSGAAAA
jgi:hypothetical protein